MKKKRQGKRVELAEAIDRQADRYVQLESTYHLSRITYLS